jgi:hypothetical protein
MENAVENARIFRFSQCWVFHRVFHRFHEIGAFFLCFCIDFPSKAPALPLASSSESVDLEATALEPSQFSQMFDDFGGVE